MRTLSQSASSSSATMSGNEVHDPWPISVAADMIVTMPSGAMLIQGLKLLPVVSPPSTAASACPSAKVNDSPAAPIITWRRFISEVLMSEVLMSDVLMCWFMSRLLRGALDGAHNALVGAAAADIRAHVLDDLVARRLRVLLEQVGRAHDLAGLTVAALRHAFGEPGLLQRMA